MILLIDNYDSFTYNLYQQLAAISDDVRVVRNDKITIDEIRSLNPAGIVLSPGPGRPENAGICIELIKAFHDSIPILGICLGHQAMTEAFGGKTVNAGAIVHGKSAHIFHNRKDLFQSLSLPLKVGRYHSLIVEKSSLPKELLITAESEDGIIMGIKHVENPCFGLQFHPESILTDEGDAIMKHFMKICGEH